MKKEEVILNPGIRIGRQHIGIMASVGLVAPAVYKQPSVGILATGSELVPATEKPEIAQIRNSNGPQLIAQLKDLGIEAKDYGIALDREKVIADRIHQAVDQNDIVLISGGVSAGDYDFVPELLKAAGFDIKFHKMKVRPGKPLLFAVRGDRYVFGIPGNPVSTFVQFEMIIRPFILGLMNCQENVSTVKMPMAREHKLSTGSLRYFIPVKIGSEGIIPTEYHGSGHLTSYAEADGILIVPPGKEVLKQGETIDVRLF